MSTGLEEAKYFTVNYRLGAHPNTLSHMLMMLNRLEETMCCIINVPKFLEHLTLFNSPAHSLVHWLQGAKKKKLFFISNQTFDKSQIMGNQNH